MTEKSKAGGGANGSPARGKAKSGGDRQGRPGLGGGKSKKAKAGKANAPASKARVQNSTAGDRNLTDGIAPRQLAVSYIRAVLVEGRVLDDVIARALREEPGSSMERRDRAHARLIAATVLRRRGQIDAILRSFMTSPLDPRKGKIWAILQAAAAQLLFLETRAHAAINIAVEQCRADRGAHRFKGLANAILRKVATEGHEMLSGQDAARLNTPDWMWDRWSAHYGDAVARKIAAANCTEAALDISLKESCSPSPAADGDAQSTGRSGLSGLAGRAGRNWARRLGGVLLPTGSVRLAPGGLVEDLPGFADGAWWVQDAAAALPAQLLGKVDGARVADICAAPGGKTAQLVARGAKVTAIDASGSRLRRLRDNLKRLDLTAAVVEADAATWKPDELFDAVLLDAPCTASGTMRRHPDIAHLKSPKDIARLAKLQADILDNAMKMLRPGGKLVYCTCSLEPEEGEAQIEALLQRKPTLRREPIGAAEIGADAAWISEAGDLRTLPFHMTGDDIAGWTDQPPGMDGFYAARLVVS